ncbi:hypothetical protein GF377_01855 [candidate division GN15 bacterium]|nr:hypothetical protein [candidate division GN15 bacterium]
MDYQSYRRAYFVEPSPNPRYKFSGTFAVTLYFEDYTAAVEYYTQVFGPPAYVEGASTRGWPIGEGWLTLLEGKDGNPRNVEVAFWMPSADEAERLQRAFIKAGGEGVVPTDELMYEPVRFCPVTDPFGTELLVVARL